MGTACRLELGLYLGNEFGMFPLHQRQLALLCQGGGWQANLHSLSLVEGSEAEPYVSQELLPLSTLTALRELTLASRIIDFDAAQVLGGLTQLVTLRAKAWAEEAGPTLPASLRHLELLDIELGQGASWVEDELNEEVQVPCGIQRVLPAGAKLRVHLHLDYGDRLREWGSLQALLARLGAQLHSWAGLQDAVGCHLVLNMVLSGWTYRSDGDGEAGLDRLLPVIIEALAPVAASVHTLALQLSSHQLGAAMSASLVRTLPSLQELHIYTCHLHDSMVAPLAQLRLLRQLRLLHPKAPRGADVAEWGQLAAALAALLADRGQVLEGVERVGFGWSGWSR